MNKIFEIPEIVLNVFAHFTAKELLTIRKKPPNVMFRKEAARKFSLRILPYFSKF